MCFRDDHFVYKEDSFCDLLLAFLHTKLLEEGYSLGSKFISLRTDLWPVFSKQEVTAL